MRKSLHGMGEEKGERKKPGLTGPSKKNLERVQTELMGIKKS